MLTRWLVQLGLLSLLSAACTNGSDEGVPPPPTNSVVDGVIVVGCATFDGPVDPPPSFVELDRSEATPGGFLNITWDVDLAAEFETSDWYAVECWNGTQWERAWSVSYVYSDAQVVPRYEAGGVNAGSLAEPGNGRIAVAEWATPGSYRVIVDRGVSVDGAIEQMFVELYFEVEV